MATWLARHFKHINKPLERRRSSSALRHEIQPCSAGVRLRAGLADGPGRCVCVTQSREIGIGFRWCADAGGGAVDRVLDRSGSPRTLSTRQLAKVSSLLRRAPRPELALALGLSLGDDDLCDMGRENRVLVLGLQGWCDRHREFLPSQCENGAPLPARGPRGTSICGAYEYRPKCPGGVDFLKFPQVHTQVP